MLIGISEFMASTICSVFNLYVLGLKVIGMRVSGGRTAGSLDQIWPQPAQTGFGLNGGQALDGFLGRAGFGYVPIGWTR